MDKHEELIQRLNEPKISVFGSTRSSSTEALHSIESLLVVYNKVRCLDLPFNSKADILSNLGANIEFQIDHAYKKAEIDYIQAIELMDKYVTLIGEQ